MATSSTVETVDDAWTAYASSSLEPEWTIRVSGFNSSSERATETLLAVGNGVAGIRGALEEGSQWSHPGTFLAGVFDHLRRTPEPPEGLHDTPALVVLPNWLAVTVRVDGTALSLTHGTTIEHERSLLLRDGLVVRRCRQQLASSDRIVRLVTLRAALQPDRHVLVQQVWMMAEDIDARIDVALLLDGATASGLVFEEPPQREAGHDVLVARTRQGEFRVALAQACEVRGDGGVIAPQTPARSPSSIRQEWRWQAARGRWYRLDRRVAYATSRSADEPVTRAAEHLRTSRRRAVSSLIADHRAAWAERWRSADLRIEGDPELERALRFSVYHLLSAANPDDERSSIGARGLTGTAYLGHVFWDTDIYMLPFFIFTWPEAARALLLYRFSTLDAARAKARALGYRGALYAWESVDGWESTPTWAMGSNGERIEILTGRFAHHIAADVAYAVRQYWQATRDDEFLRRAGAEIILETARFWASRVSLEPDGLYHIRGVVGPDEYHEPVDDSAFTNRMAAFNLRLGVQTVDWFARDQPARWDALRVRLRLTDEELAAWDAIAGRLANVPKHGVIEEFPGYFALDDFNLAALEPRSAALPVVLGLERVGRTQVIKQADVVLLCHLLQSELDPETIAANFAYYEPRCDHGSSLSPSIYALVAARIGQLERAHEHLAHAAGMDLNDRMGNSAQGIHLGACGGLWQAIVFGTAGLQLTEDGLRFDPHLLPDWRALSFTLMYRGGRIDATLKPAGQPCEFLVEHGAGAWIELEGAGRRFVKPGERLRVSRARSV